jgi:hypothetical protein
MDVLRNLFGGFTATIFRLIVVAGTLALIYVFAIRPVLDTTEKISSQSIERSNSISRSIQQSVQRQINQTNRQIRRQLVQARRTPAAPPTRTQVTRVVSNLTPVQAQRLNRCVQRAGAHLPAFNACFDRFSSR